jgi:hypothetical protein
MAPGVRVIRFARPEPNLSLAPPASLICRPEGVSVDPAAYLLAQRIAGVGVELPVHTHPNPAFRIIVFGVGKALESNWLAVDRAIISRPCSVRSCRHRYSGLDFDGR